MDTIKRNALISVLGPDAAARLLNVSVEKAAAPLDTSPVLDALDALDELIEEYTTDQNVQQLADAVNGLTADLEQQLTTTKAIAPGGMRATYKVKGPASPTITEAIARLGDNIEYARVAYPDADLIAAIDALTSQFEEPAGGWKQTKKAASTLFWNSFFGIGDRQS